MGRWLNCSKMSCSQMTMNLVQYNSMYVRFNLSPHHLYHHHRSSTTPFTTPLYTLLPALSRMHTLHMMIRCAWFNSATVLQASSLPASFTISCYHTPPCCYHTLPRYYHTLPCCYHTLQSCYHTLPRCYHTLPRCYHTPSRCYHTPPRGCYLTQSHKHLSSRLTITFHLAATISSHCARVIY